MPLQNIKSTLLAESITDNLAELQELEKVTKPGFLTGYLKEISPYFADLPSVPPLQP